MKQVLIFIIICLSFISCGTNTVVEVPVEKVHTEYIKQLQRDSIYVHDSTFVVQKGDTIYNTKYKYIYKYINVKDTVLRIDTVPKVITVTKYIEKKSTFSILYTILKCIGLAIILGVLVTIVLSIYNKLKK